MRSPRKQPSTSTKAPLRLPWRDLTDVLALGAWSAMLFRYWLSGLLLLLLHPNYAWLSNSAAIVLALLALYKLWTAIRSVRAPRATRTRASSASSEGHVTLLPRNFSSVVLLSIAIFGLVYTPKAFASQTATQRGIADTLTLTRAQPQRFVRAASPEDRSIIDWIRLINVYPEPDAYTDEAVEVEGFVLYPEGWPSGYLMVSRFVLTCCAADAYPVGLPLKVSADGAAATTDEPYPVDTWLAVTGKIMTETLNGQRQIAIAPTEIRAIETPKNPYEY
ncbi:MAG: TIGR03943 family protein [Cyanobacteria bacterium P01_C01_bin.121]